MVFRRHNRHVATQLILRNPYKTPKLNKLFVDNIITSVALDVAEVVYGDLDPRRASLSSNAIKRLLDKITNMPASVSLMIEEEPETNGITETTENAVAEVKVNGNDTEMDIGAITSKLYEMIGLLDSFKSHHNSPNPAEKIELLKQFHPLSSSIGSKILEL